MPTLTIHGAGPGLTVQDLGRPGWKAQGLSSGGAVDRLALFEAAALLGTSPGQAVIEMMGFGGTFHANADTRIALTGDPHHARPTDGFFHPRNAALFHANPIQPQPTRKQAGH